MNKFGKISGYKLNFHKSEVLPVNDTASTYPISKLPFNISLNKIKYLGIWVTKNFSDLFKCNFLPLIVQVKQDLQRWSLLPLSLAGKINCIKMNVLPKFLYLFQCIPVFIPKSFFQSLDGLISRFIWHKQIPRIKKHILQQNKDAGGLALPNFLLYYWATNTRTLLYWISGNNHPPSWFQIEKSSCESSSLTSFLCLPLTTQSSSHTNNIIVKNSLMIWMQLRRHFGLQATPLLTPLHANPLFSPSISDQSFTTWDKHGIISVKKLYINGIFASFDELARVFDLPRTHFFKYLQVRNFVRNKFPGFPSIPPNTLIDTVLNINPVLKGSISKLYNILFECKPTGSDKLRVMWSEDLNMEISPEIWQSALRRVYSSSICARHRVIQCKVVHRAHWSKSKLARIYPGTDPNCNRCHTGPAGLSHMFWTCPALFEFWKSVFLSFSAITSVTILPSPLAGLFGVLPSDQKLPAHFVDLIAFLSLIARRAILMQWRSPHPPSHTKWIKDVLTFMKLEKIRYSLQNLNAKFSKIWLPFIEHVRSLQLDIDPVG